ncbi:hypothetical protein [Streptomyces sp. NRRL F-5630]|uniref:hypothetical protein n=1 Tax=Streptomyces sp. NRRL F-5630 TaxID=1463864 RepID=UPI003EBD3202
MNLGWIEWGDAPTWFGSVAGALALGFTAFTVRQQSKQLKEQQDFTAEQVQNLVLERDLLRAEVQDRQSAQARQVRFKVEFKTGEGFPFEPESAWWATTVVNDSDRAIDSAYVEFGGLEEPQAVRLVPSQQMMDLYCVVGPGHEVAFSSRPSSEDRLEASPPVLTFTDAAGLSWRLTEDGRLRRDSSS